MRIKLLKKMYRQTNEAIKRGDVFQQRPCPFYNEMHRIFSGIEDLMDLQYYPILNHYYMMMKVKKKRMIMMN
jgi:hypothetical protein